MSVSDIVSIIAVFMVGVAVYQLALQRRQDNRTKAELDSLHRELVSEVKTMHEATMMQQKDIFTWQVLVHYIDSVTPQELHTMDFLDSLGSTDAKLEEIKDKKAISIDINAAKLLQKCLPDFKIGETLQDSYGVNVTEVIEIRSMALSLSNKLETVFSAYRTKIADQKVIEDEMTGYTVEHPNLVKFALGNGVKGGFPGLDCFMMAMVNSKHPKMSDTLAEWLLDRHEKIENRKATQADAKGAKHA